MSDYLNKNLSFWDRKYSSPNVESFVFRLKSVLLDKFCKFYKYQTYKILDFGCGEGANVMFFNKNYGFIPYGVDISSVSINVCKKKTKKFKKNFKIIDPKPSEKLNLFNEKFDLVIAIQSLYYMSDKDLQICLKCLYNHLKPGGMIFASMMGVKNNSYYNLFSNKKKNSDGLTLVDLRTDKFYKKRQKGNTYSHYINFIKNKEELERKFKIFKKKAIGFYDSDYESLNSSLFHYTYLGKK
jgi:2-polyprenyl-3-methyl-5-hydroxy-6-metoxy-1,4-benzoquinol methylase